MEDRSVLTDTRRELALRAISVMADGTLEDFEEVLHPEFLNHEQKDEPPAARGIGPATAYATALWLRDAFADLRWEIHEVVAEDDLVVIHCTMHGRHVRPFVSYDAGAKVNEAFPGHREDLREHPDPLAPPQGRQGHRALGEPRRPGLGRRAGMGAADPALPHPLRAGEAAGAARGCVGTTHVTTRLVVA